MQSQHPSKAPQLWLAYPADLRDPGAIAECRALLSEEEQARAQRFHFERDRRAFVAGRALARIALSHAHPLPPHSWEFRNNPYGKPSVEPECGLRFNIANCAELVVCLLAPDSEVGVDAEPFARAEQIIGIASKVFSATELAQMTALRDSEQPDRALSLWVLKEAYVKACGRGLSLPLEEFSFVFESDGSIRLAMHAGLDDRPERWRFCLFDRADHRVALMVENASSQAPRLKGLHSAAAGVQVWEARPPHSPGMRQSVPGPQWFSAAP